MMFSTSECRLLRAILVVVGSLNVASCNGQGFSTPHDWKTDCVGRIQLSLPGNVDVAATTLKDIERMWSPPSSSFEDEQISWGSGQVFLGEIKVVHGLTPDTLNGYMARRSKVRDELRADAENAKTHGRPYEPVTDLSVGRRNGIGFQFQGQKLLVLRIGAHGFSWSGYSGISEDVAQRNYETVLNGVRSRATFEVPDDPGVCLPYSFVRDNGKTNRDVAMTYRLTVHPDITIYLRDADASKARPTQNSAKFTARYMSDFFWTNDYGPSMRKAATSYWPDLYRKTKLAGQPAVESFVRLIRDDDTEDFGYLVVSKGDPDASEDTPDLMLYVIRDAKNARAKGVVPMNKEEFLSMARAIAASVKRRPIHP